MIKKLLPIIFFLFLISCSSENENKTSEIELSGEKVKIIEGFAGNIKITESLDLKLAEMILSLKGGACG